MSKIRRYSHSVEVTVNLGAVIMIALVVWLCVALAGCGGGTATAAAPARPAQCAALLAQLKSYDKQMVISQKNGDVISGVSETTIMEQELRQDAAAPGVPQRLKNAEDGVAAGLAYTSVMQLNTSLEQVKAVCGD